MIVKLKTKLMTLLVAASAMLGAYAANVRVYVNVVPEAGWNPDRYFYAWSGTAQNFGAWPGIKVENAEVLNGETWHYMDIDATDDEFYPRVQVSSATPWDLSCDLTVP